MYFRKSLKVVLGSARLKNHWPTMSGLGELRVKLYQAGFEFIK